MLDDVASESLQTAVAGLSTRTRISANNIANLETPGFTAQSVSFEASLASAVATGDPASARVSVDPSTATPGVNGNNVSLDAETVTDEKTQLQYQLLSGAMTSKLDLISTVLKV